MIVKVTPTPSNTPSNTPTITPSVSSCPTFVWKTNIKLFECNYGQEFIQIPLTGWTMEHSGITYSNLTDYGTELNAATWCNIPVQEPFVGASYIFNLTSLAPGWELCKENINDSLWDSFEVILTSYSGRICYTLEECVIEYNATINYYLNGVLQVSREELIGFTEYLISENPSCPPAYTMFNQVMMFEVDVIKPTPTPTITSTSTSTSTPTPTYCYNPQAYILFDAQTGATSLNSWMLSNGSTFRGMFINSPSTTFATFQSQMNAYISYSGFGATTFGLLPESITSNQDPINWISTYGWSGPSNSVWVNMLVPSCPICDDGVYGLMGLNTPTASTNPTYRSFNFYYSGTAIPQGYYRLYTTNSATDMRLSSSSPEFSLGSLVCPPTPTPTTTATQTRTPTMTPTPFEVCPTQMTINKITGAWIYPNQTYYRITSYTGGTFSGGYVYFNGATTNFIPGASPSGITYSTYGIESGGTYYNLVAYTDNLVAYRWYMFATTGDYYISKGTVVSQNFLNTNAVLNSTTTGGITYPNPGIQNTGWSRVIYPSICPTATPTSTPPVSTQTQTSTPTGTIVSTPTTTQTPSPTPFVIDCETGFIEGSYSGTSFYTYPNQPISSSVDDYIRFDWSVLDRPNRFSVYDSTGLLWTSGWVGFATYPGPWGSSLSTPSTGSSNICFLSSSGRYVLVEAGNAAPTPPQLTDAYNYTIVCLGSCITITPTITPTPSPTPVCCPLQIQTNGSLDISITTITVDALYPIVIGGVLPNEPGNGTYLCYDLPIIGTYQVNIGYNCSVAGQKIRIDSPVTGIECQNTLTGSNIMTFTTVGFDNIGIVQVFPEDGTC